MRVTVRERYPYRMIREQAELAPATPDAAIAAVLDQPGACAQLSFDFLGFMHVYRAAANVLPRSVRVIDFGAASAIQAWYFVDFASYTAVEPASIDEYSLSPAVLPACGRSVRMRAQEFLKTHAIDPARDFIICSAVPDEGVLDAVRASGACYIWWYPGGVMECRGAMAGAVAALLSR